MSREEVRRVAWVEACCTIVMRTLCRAAGLDGVAIRLMTDCSLAQEQAGAEPRQHAKVRLRPRLLPSLPTMPSTNPLPFELEQLLLTQLSTLELCESLFPLTNELTLSPSTALLLPSLRPLTTHHLPASLSFTLLLTLPPFPDEPPYEI